MKKYTTLLAWLLLGHLAVAAPATPRAVAQAFYGDWLKLDLNNGPGSGEKLLAAHQALFEPGLYRRVVDTWKLDENPPIEGYDEYPFFDTQDQIATVRLGQETPANGTASMLVYARGGRGGKPTGTARLVVTVELQQVQGKWRIIDLIYPHDMVDNSGKNKTRSLRKWSQMLLDGPHKPIH